MQYFPAGPLPCDQPERLPFDQHSPSYGWEKDGDRLFFYERWPSFSSVGGWLTEEEIHWIRVGRKIEDPFYGMNLDEINDALAAWWDERGGPPPVWACSNPMHHPSQNKQHTVVKCGGAYVWGRAVRCTEPDSFGRLLHDGPCSESRTFEQEQADVEAYAEAHPHLHESVPIPPHGRQESPSSIVRSKWNITQMFTTMDEETFFKMSKQPADLGYGFGTMLQMLLMKVVA